MYSNLTSTIDTMCTKLQSFRGEWEGWDPVNRFKHTSWMDVVTVTDRPKSVRNHCGLEVIGGVLVLSFCFLEYAVGVN